MRSGFLPFGPLADELNNFSHIGTVALDRAGGKFMDVHAISRAFMLTGLGFAVHRALVKGPEYLYLAPQCGTTRVIEKKQTRTQVVKRRLVSNHHNTRIIQKVD
jgi:hypothetical protein